MDAAGLREILIRKDYSLPPYLLSSTDQIIDLGASIGDYAIFSSKTALKVLSVEADKESFKLLLENIELNNATNVVPLNIVISDRNGLVRWSSRRINNEKYTYSIECLTLDCLVEKLDLEPDVIKMDVEGSELAVLIGGTNTLKKFRPKIVAEIHSDELKTKCLDYLNALDYDLVRDTVLFEPVHLMWFVPKDEAQINSLHFARQ